MSDTHDPYPLVLNMAETFNYQSLFTQVAVPWFKDSKRERVFSPGRMGSPAPELLEEMVLTVKTTACSKGSAQGLPCVPPNTNREGV